LYSLDAEELQMALIKGYDFQDGVDGDFLADVWTPADTDGDGKVSYEEFLP
jgi:hypothetical protein